jgi:gag-polypeptide of LTR copia-type/Zinc knuckle
VREIQQRIVKEINWVFAKYKMGEGTQGETSIKVVLFAGKMADWTTWEEKFLARAKRWGYKEILLGKVEIPTEEMLENKNKESEPISEEEIRRHWYIMDLNDNRYSDLVLSMDTSMNAGRVAFSLVRASKSKDYPDGNIAVAWSKLKKKYAPTTAHTLAKYHKIFYSAKLKQGSDPDSFLTYLEEVRLKMEEMGPTISDTQFLLHVMNNLTHEYEMQVNRLERKIEDKVDPPSIEDLREKLSLQFERLNIRKRDENVKDQDQDQALYAGGQFKGKCRSCGKIGHKAVECKLKNSGNKFDQNQTTENRIVKPDTFTCNYCGKPGHKYAECRKRNRDESES